jgi:hypothetical protein
MNKIKNIQSSEFMLLQRNTNHRESVYFPEKTATYEPSDRPGRNTAAQ